MDAPRDAVRERGSYNLAGMSFTPEEIARYQKIVESTSRKIHYFC